MTAEKQKFIDDQTQRSVVEGMIGQGMRRFGFGLIREKLAVTQISMIALNLLVMNLVKLLEFFVSSMQSAGNSLSLLYRL